MITDNEKKALCLIQHGADQLTPRANAILNGQIKGLLAKGLVRYDAKRRAGYALTPVGKRAL